MLRWVSEPTRYDWIKNECTEEKFELAFIVEKLVESRLE